jgi:hypothetical protein
MHKQLIYGKVYKIVGNKAYVRCGDVMDIYNLEYYRIAEGTE